MIVFNDITAFEASNTYISNIAKLGTRIPNSLSFILSENQLSTINKNRNVIALIGPNTLRDKIQHIEHVEYFIISENVIDDFQYFYNQWNTKTSIKQPSQISEKASIHPTAFIDPWDVIIHDNVIIDAMVVIHRNTIIEQNSIIRSSTVLGSEGFEVVTVQDKKTVPFHNGKLIIGENVQIQAGCTIDKGIYGENTVIGNNTKLDNHIHVGHNASIGKNCIITAGSIISGNVVIGDDVYIGPGSIISNRISIGNKARINIGSTVINNVLENDEVSGHFAENHRAYLKQKILLRKMLQKKLS